MPDHGERLFDEIERNLGQLEVPPCEDEPNYGTALLETATASLSSVGRKRNGGIMFLPHYKGPTVNIRPPKWPDNKFWIKAEDYEAAQYIADAVCFHIGRAPFHFPGTNFRYPPLCLSTQKRLTTREMCAVHVAKIAKGAALRNDRADYRDRVKKLVLNAVKGIEAVQFLRNLRAIPRAPFRPTEYIALQDNEESLSPVHDDDDDDASGDHETPMEDDALSEQAILSLVPAVNPACVLHLTGLAANLSGDLDISAAFTPGFGMYFDDFGGILHSECHSLVGGFFRWAQKPTIPEDLEKFLTTLDKDEEEIFRSTKWPDLEEIYSLQPNNFGHTLRFN